MSSIKQKVQKAYHNFRQRESVSSAYAWVIIACNLCESMGLEKSYLKMQRRKDAIGVRYLTDFMEPVLAECRKTEVAPREQTGQEPIWVCWWQGEEAAPPLVKRCLRSIREQAGEHPVHMITKDNYGEFVEIPEYMLQKVADGKMCLAHLADFIRVSLLARWGGLWIDATIFLSRRLPEEYFTYPVITCKNEKKEEAFLSGGQWTGFFIGGYQGHPLFCFLRDAFARYWENHDFAIAYHFYDYLIAVAYQQLLPVREALDTLPANNSNLYVLRDAMRRNEPAKTVEEWVKPDTIVYKLERNENFVLQTAQGEQTIYGAFLQ